MANIKPACHNTWPIMHFTPVPYHKKKVKSLNSYFVTGEYRHLIKMLYLVKRIASHVPGSKWFIMRKNHGIILCIGFMTSFS